MAYDPINPLIPQQNPSLSNQGAFRFWVQTVLPTIYDDSLSYYELLNKVVQVLNAAISDVDALHSYIEESIPPQDAKINEAVGKVNGLGEQFDTLKGYVDNYFENLDVQDEINNKLNAMAADGTLTELIEGILGSSTAINQAVADWLEDYAETSGITAPAIDTTLSVAGAAADAKTVGDELSEKIGIYPTLITTQSQLNSITNNTLDFNNLTANTFFVVSIVTLPSGVAHAPVTTTSMNGTIVNLSSDGVVDRPGNIQIFYSNSTFKTRRRGSSGWNDWIEFVKTSDLTTALSQLDIPAVDDTLSIAGAAADAAAVGAALANKISIRTTMVTSATGLNAVTNNTLDFDNLIANTYVVISATNVSNVVHSPTGTGTINGTIINLSLDGTADRAGNVQTYFASSSIRVRRRTSTGWGDWKVYVTTDYVDQAIAEITIPVVEKYYVGANREYTSLVTLLLDERTNTNEKIIYIDDGEYDIFAEYLAEVTSGRLSVPPDNVAADNYDYPYNAIVPPNTKIMGLGNVTLKMMPSANDVTYGESRTWSPINVYGNVELENLTIIGKNCRYCIHDDSHNNSSYRNTVHRYKNVHCIYTYSDEKNSQRLGYNNTIGFGFSSGSLYEFKDCIFEFNGSGNHGIFYGHNHNNADNNSNLIIENCVIIGTDSTNNRMIRLQSLSHTACRVITKIINSYVGINVINFNLYDNESVQSFDVYNVKSGTFSELITKPEDNTTVNPYVIKNYS